MSFRIYHQCGHQTAWNKQAIEDLEAGDGLILSPVHENKERLESGLKLTPRTKGSSFFDPQFYLPNSPKKNFKTFPFFPETLTEGFSTNDFSIRAIEAARLCVEFQIQEGYDRIIIPLRYQPQMKSDYCEAQSAYAVTPFLTAIQEAKRNLNIFVTLPVTQYMIRDQGFRDRLLNWITGYQEIDGVYLILDKGTNSKQIVDTGILTSALAFITQLLNADLEVLVGYCNSENLIYSITGDIEVTFGAYENTRMFSLDKFIEKTGDQRGPRARIYLPGLFNWVQLEQAREIRSDVPDIWNEIYGATDESERALNAKVPWAFNKPELYMHHFEIVARQVANLSPMTREERISILIKQLANAKEFYIEIRTAGIQLDPHGCGTHINPWLAAIEEYASSLD